MIIGQVEWMSTAFVDPFLVARQLPHHPVNGTSWQGVGVITHALRGIPHRFDRLTFIWAATQATHHEALEFALSDVARVFGMRWSDNQVAKSLDRLHHSRIEVQNANSPMVIEPSMLTTFEHLAVSNEKKRAVLRFGSLFRGQGAIPVDVNLIFTLARSRSLRTIDQYLWQTTKAHQHRDELPITIPLKTVSTELGCPQTQPRKSLHFLRKRQQRLLELQPHLSHKITSTAFVLQAE